MISICISIVGYFVGFRWLQHSLKKMGWLEVHRQKIYAAHSILIAGVYLLLKQSAYYLWIFHFFGLLLILSGPKIYLWHMRKKFCECFNGILDEVILTMQSGATLRIAMQTVISKESGFLKVQLQEILNQIVFPENVLTIQDPNILRILKEFLEVDQARAKSLDQLKSFRRILNLEKEFDRKESQIQASVQMQMGLMLILFCALLAFVGNKFGFAQNLGIIGLSVMLFIGGLIIMYFVGRNRKWQT